MVSPDQDFHPTDIQEDADGSLLIVDTGGWYKLCCPTSQLVKPDILGGIYRVRREGAARVEDPRGLRLDWEKASSDALADRLGDARPAVGKRAIDKLAQRGEPALDSLAKSLQNESAQARRNTIWALMRIESPKARALVRSAAHDSDASVEIAVRHSISVCKDIEAKRILEQSLAVDPPQVRRVAVEALGRIGDSTTVDRLFEIGDPANTDRILEHSIIYALIEIGNLDRIRHYAWEGEDHSRSIAYTVLDQLTPGDQLEAFLTAAAMKGGGEELRRTTFWIASHRPTWADEIRAKLCATLRQRLESRRE